jgi:hypothetical protein
VFPSFFFGVGAEQTRGLAGLPCGEGSCPLPLARPDRILKAAENMEDVSAEFIEAYHIVVNSIPVPVGMVGMPHSGT